MDRKNYSAVHYWLRSRFGKACKCENPDCKSLSRNYQWAKLHGGEYEKIRENFIQLCASCHAKYDSTEFGKKLMGQKNSVNQKRVWQDAKRRKKQSQRMREYVKKGICKTNQVGSKQWQAKLTEDQVRQIKQMINNGHRGCDIADLFNITRVCVSAIKTGREWKHVLI